MLRRRLGHNLARKATVSVSDTRGAGAARNYVAGNLTDNRPDTYWATHDDNSAATVTLTWKRPQTVRYVQLMEYIRLGQRIKRFHVEISEDGTSFHRVASNVATTTVGYKRIIPLNGSTKESYGKGFTAKALRVVIDDSKACPTLCEVGVY